MIALDDPSRRALYEYVRRAGHPVSREEAADATAMSRGLAAFHLDKLVEAGLLAARYQAAVRRRGRTPKVYEPTPGDVTVSVPERRYRMVAEILAAAVDEDPTHADRAATRQAYRHGHALGEALRDGGLDAALGRLGFEPDREAGRVVLRNCPFHALAEGHPALVCGLNQALLSGLTEGLGAAGVQARLAPHPGRCCVELVETEHPDRPFS